MVDSAQPTPCAACGSRDVVLTEGLAAYGAGPVAVFFYFDPGAPPDDDADEAGWAAWEERRAQEHATLFLDLALCRECGLGALQVAPAEGLRAAALPALFTEVEAPREPCRCGGVRVRVPGALEVDGADVLHVTRDARSGVALEAWACSSFSASCARVTASVAERSSRRGGPAQPIAAAPRERARRRFSRDDRRCTPRGAAAHPRSDCAAHAGVAAALTAQGCAAPPGRGIAPGMSFGPGWDALDAIFEARYPGVEPRVFGSLVDPIASPNACKQVAAWPDGAYWHLVGYGLTELFAKQSPMPDQDGWGYELTMRVRRDASDPPAWAASLIGAMIRYVEDTGARLAEGEWFAYTDGGPLIPGTHVAAALLLRDTALPERHRTPFGNVLFRQVVGITAEELALIKHEGPERLIAALRAWSPALETSPDRAALLTRAVEGVPMAPAPASPLRPWRSLEAKILRLSRSFTGEREVELGADDARLVGAHLAQILAKEGELRVASEHASVAFVRGEGCRVDLVEEDFGRDVLRIELSLELASAVADVLRAAPTAGASAVPGVAGVRFRRVDR